MLTHPVANTLANVKLNVKQTKSAILLLWAIRVGFVQFSFNFQYFFFSHQNRILPYIKKNNHYDGTKIKALDKLGTCKSNRHFRLYQGPCQTFCQISHQGIVQC